MNYTNYTQFYNENKLTLRKVIAEKYEELYPNAKLFLAGTALYSSRERDELMTLVLSQSELREILSETSLEVKSNMSNKVTLLVWTTNAWYTKEAFEKFKAYDTYISWEEFLKPAAEIVREFARKKTNED